MVELFITNQFLIKQIMKKAVLELHIKFNDWNKKS